jgi:hypothetical protein
MLNMRNEKVISLRIVSCHTGMCHVDLLIAFSKGSYLEIRQHGTWHITALSYMTRMAHH